MALENHIISLIIIGANLLGIVFSITGLAEIEWDFTTNANKGLFITLLPFFIVTLGISVLFFFVFFKKLLTNSNKTLMQIIAIAAIIISLIGLVFAIVCLSIGCSKFSDAKDLLKTLGINRPSKGERATMVCMTVFCLLMDVIQIPLWVLLLLAVLKYNGNLNNSNTEVKVNYGQREINLN